MFSDDHMLDDETRESRQFGQQLFGVTPNIYVVPALIVINVLVFVWMRTSGIAINDPDARALLPWGASFGPLTTGGEWWRLLTATFLHGSLMHIFFNMLLLWQGGQLVERMFGHAGFAVIYVLSGLGGSVASVYWHPTVIGVGASGAVFGVYGALGAFALINRKTLPSNVVSGLINSALTFVIGNTVYGFLLPRVDVAAHTGGLVSGFAAALMLWPTLAGPPVRWAFIRPVTIMAIGLAVIAGAAAKLPAYDDLPVALVRLFELEKATVARYNAGLKTLQDKEIDEKGFADVLEQEVLPPWKARQAELSHLRVTPGDTITLTSMLAYMSARTEAWELRMKGLRDGDNTLLEESVKKETAAVALERRLAAVVSRRRPVDNGVLTVVVTDPAGPPVAGATVTLACPEQRPDPTTVSSRYEAGCKTPLTGRSNSEGQVLFREMPGGPYVVTVDASSYKRDERPVEVTDNSAESVRLAFAVDLQAEVAKVQDVEKIAVAAYDRAVKQLQSRKLNDAEFATAVEALIPPFRETREKLAGLEVASSQRPIVEKLVKYMTLREEGWGLIAKGARANDGKLVQQANEKQKEAMELFKKP